MVKTRLMRVAFLACVMASTSFAPDGGSGEPSPDEGDEWQRFSTRCASDSLRTLSEAEPDFRANDRDWNHVNDFWTADVSGLYTLTSTDVLLPGTKGALRVIEFTRDSAEGQEEP